MFCTLIHSYKMYSECNLLHHFFISFIYLRHLTEYVCLVIGSVYLSRAAIYLEQQYFYFEQQMTFIISLTMLNIWDGKFNPEIRIFSRSANISVNIARAVALILSTFDRTCFQPLLAKTKTLLMLIVVVPKLPN